MCLSSLNSMKISKLNEEDGYVLEFNNRWLILLWFCSACYKSKVKKYLNISLIYRIWDMYILGISSYYHDSAACLLKDGEIFAAAQE